MFQKILEQVSLALKKHAIEYMIIGGQALLVYGEPRLTRDVDITLGLGAEAWARIRDLVKQLKWRVLVESPEAFVKETLVLPCQDPSSGIRIDFIFSFSSYEREALKRAREILVGKVPVRFASAEDLIIHKVVAGRARDLEDVRTILLKNPQIDRDYIRRWLKEFEDSLSQPFWQRFQGIS